MDNNYHKSILQLVFHHGKQFEYKTRYRKHLLESYASKTDFEFNVNGIYYDGEPIKKLKMQIAWKL